MSRRFMVNRLSGSPTNLVLEFEARNACKWASHGRKALRRHAAYPIIDQRGLAAPERSSSLRRSRRARCRRVFIVASVRLHGAAVVTVVAVAAAGGVAVAICERSMASRIWGTLGRFE